MLDFRGKNPQIIPFPLSVSNPEPHPFDYERIPSHNLSIGDKVIVFPRKTGTVVQIAPFYDAKTVTILWDKPNFSQYPTMEINTASTPFIRRQVAPIRLGLDPAAIRRNLKRQGSYYLKHQYLLAYARTGIAEFKRCADSVEIGAEPITEIKFGGAK